MYKQITTEKLRSVNMELKKLTKAEYVERISDFVELFQRCFNREILEEHLKWRYIENPIEDFFVYVAIDKNKVVANYSVSPVMLINNNEIYKSALSMTTMTHPDYGGRGIFKKLASLLYSDMEHEGYHMVWGFPNDNSHRTFINKLNWNDVYEIPTMELELNGKNKFIKDSLSQVFEDNTFELEYSNYNDGLIKVKKDKSYLKWRYLQNPMHTYQNFVVERNGKATSYLIFKCYGKNEIDIVDFLAGSLEEGEELLGQFILYITKLSINTVNTWTPIHSENHLLFEKIGFRNHTPITYFGKRNINSCNKTKFNSYHDWYIQMGDSDVY